MTTNNEKTCDKMESEELLNRIIRIIESPRSERRPGWCQVCGRKMENQFWVGHTTEELDEPEEFCYMHDSKEAQTLMRRWEKEEPLSKKLDWLVFPFCACERACQFYKRALEVRNERRKEKIKQWQERRKVNKTVPDSIRI